MTYRKTTGKVCPQLNQLTITASLLLGLSIVPMSAHALQCGDTIGPKETVILDSDIGPCQASEGGLTIRGPTTLDLNGFALSCQNLGNGVPNGITIEGKNAKVRNGSIENCLTGVVITGEGKHRLENLTVQEAAISGFHIQSDSNMLAANSAEDSGFVGFLVSGHKNRLTHNSAKGSHSHGFRLSGDKNKLTSNTAMANEDGFHVRGDRNRLTKNTATSNDFYGFLDDRGDRNAFVRNTATANRVAGFLVGGSKGAYSKNITTGNNGSGFEVHPAGRKSRLNGNQAEQNGGHGIFLLSGTEIALTKNRAVNNDSFGSGRDDLHDANPDCGVNRWRNNEFRH